MKIEELDLDVRQFNMLKRAGIDTTEDFINYPDKERLKKLTGRTYGVMEELLKVGNVSDDEISAPAQTETAVVFDYSELDTDTAAKLESLTAEIFNVRKEYIFTMAKKVAYAHDLLANYGNGKFGAWCESIGITRQTGNNLIQIVKLFDNSTEIERQNLEKLTDGNVKLLYEAARPSAPAELVEAVKNGDITTHKEYIALKKQLEEANEQLEQQKINNQHLSEGPFPTTFLTHREQGNRHYRNDTHTRLLPSEVRDYVLQVILDLHFETQFSPDSFVKDIEL